MWSHGIGDRRRPPDRTPGGWCCPGRWRTRLQPSPASVRTTASGRPRRASCRSRTCSPCTRRADGCAWTLRDGCVRPSPPAPRAQRPVTQCSAFGAARHDPNMSGHVVPSGTPRESVDDVAPAEVEATSTAPAKTAGTPHRNAGEFQVPDPESQIPNPKSRVPSPVPSPGQPAVIVQSAADPCGRRPHRHIGLELPVRARHLERHLLPVPPRQPAGRPARRTNSPTTPSTSTRSR